MPELPFMADDFCNELLTDSSAFLRESAEPGAATQNASWHMPDGDAEPIENQRIRTGDGQQDETGNENEADRYGKACSAGGGCGTDCRSN